MNWLWIGVLAVATSAFAQAGTAPQGPLKVDRDIFLRLDRDHDQLLTREEARRDNIANAYFQLADTDGDHRLSEAEYLAIASATAFGPDGTNGPNGAAGRPGDAGDRLLGPPNVEGGTGPGTGPTGGGGGSNGTSVILAPGEPGPGEPGMDEDAFTRLDLNGDGVLSREEARVGRITDDFRDADRDRDGSISSTEYQAYVRTQPDGTAIGSPPAGNAGPSR